MSAIFSRFLSLANALALAITNQLSPATNRRRTRNEMSRTRCARLKAAVMALVSLSTASSCSADTSTGCESIMEMTSSKGRGEWGKKSRARQQGPTHLSFPIAVVNEKRITKGEFSKCSHFPCAPFIRLQKNFTPFSCSGASCRREGSKLAPYASAVFRWVVESQTAEMKSRLRGHGRRAGDGQGRR